MSCRVPKSVWAAWPRRHDESIYSKTCFWLGWAYHLLIRIMIREWFFGWVGRFEKILLFVIYFYFLITIIMLTKHYLEALYVAAKFHNM